MDSFIQKVLGRIVIPNALLKLKKILSFRNCEKDLLNDNVVNRANDEQIIVIRWNGTP